MDFPKSVPGVGLVGGQFADENPSIGQQGSLIPSAWGNAVTHELLNVIRAAGLEPNEEQADQLLEAIRTLAPERSAFARVSGTVALPVTAFGIYALADGGAAATVTLPDTEVLVEDTELLLFANHSNTAAVQVKAATGQTVQGPAALMRGSTTAFMLPAGGDWVRLCSEKEQGRWVVVSSYTNDRLSALEGVLQSTYVYPAGGGAGSEGMISANQVLSVANPYPGKRVECCAEIFLDGDWVWSGHETGAGSSSNAYFVNANQKGGNIVTVSGISGVATVRSVSGTPANVSVGVSSAKLRVRVKRVGITE